MDKRQHSPELIGIGRLPNDVLLLILSFLPSLAEVARTSILSRRWRNIWHNISRLNFDAVPLLPRNHLRKSHKWYKEWVNKVLALPGLTSVKYLQIHYELTAMDEPHINSWINFAIANRVETLYLDCSPYNGLVLHDRQYKLSEELWYKAPSGLSSLHCLKSLTLLHVNVTKQFIEFILSSCPILEDLCLEYVGPFTNLDISSLQLRRLRIDNVEGSALNTLSAPRLTSFFFYAYSGGFNPQKIDVPMLTDLTIGGKICTQHIMEYLKHFWSYLPRLEKLDLIMEEDQEFKLQQITELVKLKYLKMRFDMDTDPIWDRIICFLNACPVLETFVFQILDGSKIPKPNLVARWRSMEQEISEAEERLLQKLTRRYNTEKERQRCDAEKSCEGFRSLVVLELVAGKGKVIDQEVVKFIISKAHYLRKLIIDVRLPRPYLLSSPCSEMVEVVEAKAKELCPPPIEIYIIGKS